MRRLAVGTVDHPYLPAKRRPVHCMHMPVSMILMMDSAASSRSIARRRRTYFPMACAASIAVAALLPVSAARSQSSGIDTYCNPIDIEYRYNFEQLNQGISYRSGADPVIVPFRGEYYLFETIAGGWWRSPDLVHWHFVTPARWPFQDMVAPAALAARDTIFLMQSSFEQRPIMFSTAPSTGDLRFYNRWLPPIPGGAGGPPGRDTRGPWDPALFRDDDGRWYLYWGSSNKFPLYGIELDTTRRLAYSGTAHELVRLHPDVHGWERFGRDHRDTLTPYIEGAWMTKHGGKYYLQYAAPGTEYNVYANGTYVGDSPLGPFTYAPYNPVSYKPGGFATGAGHGNTFRDNHGNYWNTGTSWIGLNWKFERRIVMFPAGFDANGEMFSDTRFGDFPHYTPRRRWQSPEELFTGWMLLSYRKSVTASSARDSFPAINLTDEDPRTIWVARSNTPREWVTIDLGRPYTVRALQVNYADYRSGLFGDDSTVYTQFRASASADGRHWTTIADLMGERRDRPNAYVQLARPIRARFVRYEHVYTGARNLAISDIRIFGNGGGRPPATPHGVTARRNADPRDAVVSWKPVRGVVGYNVRWGLAPSRLRQTYQTWADAGTTLEVRALTAGQSYYFAVESFDENGVSRLSRVVRVP